MMPGGIFLIVLGIILAVLVHYLLGLLLIGLGILLLFYPGIIRR